MLVENTIKKYFVVCYTISEVISVLVAPGHATMLWMRNLSLHCMSGGASSTACIVTTNSH